MTDTAKVHRFTDGKPWQASAKDCAARWSCGKPGEFFRCALCGHKFVEGDTVRWQYTNDTPGAGGNPLVCAKCDVGRDGIIAEILRRRSELEKGEWAWFIR